MKKLSVLVCAAAALCALASSKADAQTIIKPPPGILKALNTRVQGKINVSVPSQLSNLTCANITVVASSVEMQPAAPGSFSAGPKWTRSAKASGAALGACSYSIDVPGNSAFNLSISSASTNQCQIVSGQPTPNAYVSVTVPAGTTKSFDFAANMLCQKLH